MRKLFELHSRKVSTGPDPFSIITPLGKVVCEAVFDKTLTSKVIPNVIEEISKDVFIYIWNIENCHIELLKADITPKLPMGMHVDKCTAFFYRFKILSKEMPLKFSCRLAFKERKPEREPESGEGLIAQSWDDENVRITIGTEDEEYLFSRAERGKWLPSRLASMKLITPEVIEYLEDGIEISLPSFQENEEGQVQFVISWAKKSKQDDISTWFAVDANLDKILKHIELRSSK